MNNRNGSSCGTFIYFQKLFQFFSYFELRHTRIFWLNDFWPRVNFDFWILRKNIMVSSSVGHLSSPAKNDR